MRHQTQFPKADTKNTFNFDSQLPTGNICIVEINYRNHPEYLETECVCALSDFSRKFYWISRDWLQNVPTKKPYLMSLDWLQNVKSLIRWSWTVCKMQ